MSGLNWNRPVHRLRGREMESIYGDLPRSVFNMPRPPRVSKERLRAKGEDAHAKWLAKGRQKFPKKRPLRRKSWRQCHE